MIRTRLSFYNSFWCCGVANSIAFYTSAVVTLTNSGDGSEGHFGAKTIATGGSLVNNAKTIA